VNSSAYSNALSSSEWKASTVLRTAPRSYTMRARQSTVEETRRAITEATMRLHERVGPRATTVSAVAEEANVTRLTVYRHFPSDDALVIACSAHWRELHPRPDPAAWARIRDPVVRLRTALTETYRWAATAAPMMTMIHRDVDVMPSFVGDYLAADEKHRVAVLAVGFSARGRAAQRLRAVLAHALRLSTWQSLCADGGLTESQATDVMVGAMLAALGPLPAANKSS
jgi:AcrR family transcriptional regulator